MLQVNFASQLSAQYPLANAHRSVNTIEQAMMSKLAKLSQHQQQWILFTSECPRPQYERFAYFNIHCDRVIHMKPSQTLSELEIVIKAIRSGNASAIIASNTIEPINQHLLKQLATEHHCDVFFVAGKQQPFH
ncbi:hypothetical protein EA004_00695 [Vibrio anguillarum]|uniref:Superfamily II DNA and RNA helicase n=1 Tax=Vibrio anguillarum TaxID=55601 RepID=A0ABR9Z0E4_VIBAN|nr:hypothetical protein [Vibrio anguillarum]MBF4243570.1 hypothetical protein [Vibrio anguillarum]MBF4371828.1 hypothetical protein [Vibrio anguillarum]